MTEGDRTKNLLQVESDMSLSTHTHTQRTQQRITTGEKEHTVNVMVTI